MENWKPIALIFGKKWSVFDAFSLQLQVENENFSPKSKAIGLQFSTKILHFQHSSTPTGNQKVPKNTQFSPKSKAIGLPFSKNIIHFQLSSTPSRNQKGPKNTQFSPKSKAIGLPFSPKILHFQHFPACL